MGYPYGNILRRYGIVFAGILIFSGLSGCRHESAPTDDRADVLVEMGDSVLTRTWVLSQIPEHLDPADSTALFRAIVEDWVETMLLNDLAEENISDLEEIDRQTRDYRRRLIIASYRRQMLDTHIEGVSEENVRKYYDSHSGNYLLEEPVVKGLFIKVPSSSARLGDIRRWMATSTPDAIDNLEKYCLQDALAYLFFEDKWIPWSRLRRQIPYDFKDSEKFVATTRDFETTYGGITYFLHFSSHMGSGNEMPYEVAAPQIRELLDKRNAGDYTRRLIRELSVKAAKEGKLNFVNYKL